MILSTAFGISAFGNMREEPLVAAACIFAYRLDTISQGPKNSRCPGPNPLPLALVIDLQTARIKNITHGAV